MNLIFIGLLFDDESLREARRDSKIPLAVATDTFQQNLLRGIRKNGSFRLAVLNMLPIGSFPLRYRKISISDLRWGADNRRIRFLNLPFIKRADELFGLKRALKELLNDFDPADTAVLAYSIYGPSLSAMKWVKKQYPAIHTFVLQTDAVPGRNDMKNGLCYTLKGNSLVSRMRSTDGFILFTKYLKDEMEVGGRPYMIMEGIADTSDDAALSGCKNESKEIPRFLYTGTLYSIYGIKEMVDAFVALGGSAELHICGDGDTKDYIRSVAKEHPYIVFHGFIPHEEARALQKECDFLINPRRPSGSYTKYSFPSKTMEYLMTGRPLVMYKLEGIPDEYDPYINYLYGTDSVQISEELKRIIQTDYKLLAEKAEKAKAFVIHYKNETYQANRILNFIKEVCEQN